MAKKKPAATVTAGVAMTSASYRHMSKFESPGREDALELVRFKPPESLYLQFCDGRQLNMSVASIGIESVDWATASASPTGDAMIVRDCRGNEVPVDAATLRYLADPEYAAKIDLAIESLHTPQSELQKMLPFCEPPQEWHDEDHNEIVE